MAHPFVQGGQGRRTDEAKAVMAKMKEVPINDFMTRNGRIREDGRVIRDMCPKCAQLGPT
jgi:branched-chain amino acid transport system substrate-binding protein